MYKNTNSTTGSIGISTVLFLIFLVLKLCNVLDWSWWWITSPLWISSILYVLAFIILFIYYCLEDTRWERQRKKRRKKDDKD